MEFSHDELRRQALDTQAQHDAAMKPWRSALSRIFDGEGRVSSGAKSDLVAAGVARRRFMQIGGLSIASAAVLAACGDDDTTSSPGTTAGGVTTTSAAGGGDAAGDILILRTAASIEALAVVAYQTGIDSGLVTTAAIGDAAKLFQSQHKEHQEFFNGLAEKLGGKPFTDPNPVVLESLKPTIDALSDEMGIVQLAYDLEVAAAETYQANVGEFSNDMTLNQAVMTVGGVEARHAAVLASVLKQTSPPAAFQVEDKAVPAGTGV